MLEEGPQGAFCCCSRHSAACEYRQAVGSRSGPAGWMSQVADRHAAKSGTLAQTQQPLSRLAFIEGV